VPLQEQVPLEVPLSERWRPTRNDRICLSGRAAARLRWNPLRPM